MFAFRWLAILILCILSISTMTLAKEAKLSQRQLIEKRIKPFSQVKIKEAVQQGEANQAVDASDRGKHVFNQYCSMCHSKDPKIKGIGAPVIGDKDAWKPRIEKGFASLVKSVMDGLNAMPPKGTCIECNASDVERAIRFMLPDLEEKQSS